MTVQRDGQETYLECDDCTETSAPDTEFAVMIAAAKATGWKITLQFGDSWSHTCPTCQEGSRLTKAQALFR